MSTAHPELPPPALRAHVARELAALAHRRTLLLAALGVAVAAWLAWLAHRHPTHPGAAGRWAPAIIGLQALSGLVLVGAAFGRPSLGRRGLAAVGLALAVGGTTLLVPLMDFSGAGHLAHPMPGLPGHAPAPPPRPFGGGLACLLVGTGYAVAVALALGLVGARLLRRHMPVGLFLGLGTAHLAWGPLNFACRAHDPAHLLVWHGLVPPVTVLLAWGVHRLWTRGRTRA